MSRLQSVLWVAFAACWVIPILRMCQAIGGCQWIGHMGHTGSVVTAALMIALCSLAPISSFLSGAVPGVLRFMPVLASALHLLHAAWFFYFVSANGHVPPLLRVPFMLLGMVFPSAIVTANISILLALYVALPFACLVLAVFGRRDATTSGIAEPAP